MKYPGYVSKKDWNKQVEYISLWTANTHHFLICSIATYTMCHSECENAYNFIFIYDPVCFYTLDNGCVVSSLITSGYLTYDYILYRFFMDQKDPVNQQTMWHHIIGTSGLFCGLYTGFGIPTIANCAMFCELSTIFLNYRSMYTKEELNSTVPLINQIMFFITFTVIRIMIFPILSAMLAITAYMTWDQLDGVKKVTATITVVFFWIMLALNLYWYSLIIKGLRKLLIANGILKGDKKKDTFIK